MTRAWRGGFVPLFTANVYYRQGMAALRQAEPFLGRRAMFEALLWGAILAYAIPGAIQAKVTLTTRAALRDVIAGDDAHARAAVATLERYRWVADFDPMRRAYEREQDPARRERLEQDYRHLTGNEIGPGPERFTEYGGPERLIGL